MIFDRFFRRKYTSASISRFMMKRHENDSVTASELEYLLISGKVDIFEKRYLTSEMQRMSQYKRLEILFLKLSFSSDTKVTYEYEKTCYKIEKINLEFGKFLDDLFKSQTVHELIIFYHREYNNIERFLLKYPFIGERIIVVYFHHLFHENCGLRNLNFEQSLLIEIEKITRKRVISVKEFGLLGLLINLVDNGIIVAKVRNDDFFINVQTLRNVITVFTTNFDLYIGFFENGQRYGFNEHYVSALRLLLTLDESNPLSIDNINKRLNIFIESNRNMLSYQTKLMYDFVNEKLKKYEKIEEMIGKFHSNQNELDLLNIVLQYVYAHRDPVKLRHILDLALSATKQEFINEYNKKQIDLLIAIIKFWLGEDVDFDDFNGVIIPEYIVLVTHYKLRKITLDEFCTNIDKIPEFSSRLIYSWPRIELIFKDVGFSWLIKIVEKTHFEESDSFTRDYFRSFFKNVFEEKTLIHDVEYMRLYDLLQTKSKSDHVIDIYAYLTRVGLYKNKSVLTSKIGQNVIDSFGSIKNLLPNESITTVLIYLSTISVKDLSDNTTKKLTDLISEHIADSIIRNLCFYYISLIRNKIPEFNYIELAIDLTKIYADNDVSIQVFTLIQSISNLILKQEIEYAYDNLLGVIFIDNDGKLVVYEMDAISDLTQTYESLKISIRSTIDSESRKDNILNILIMKSFFKHGEAKGSLVAFKVPVNAKAPEIVKIMGDVMGREEKKRAIVDHLSGVRKIETPWLNVFDQHSFIKCFAVLDNKQYLFQESKNDDFLYGDVLVTFEALLLLERIGELELVVRRNDVYITNEVFSIIENDYLGKIVHFEDIIDNRVFYKKIIDNLYKIICVLKERNRIIAAVEGLPFPQLEIENINILDREVLLFAIENDYNGVKFSIISDDIFFRKSKVMSTQLQGVLSFLIDCYKLNMLTSSELRDSLYKLSLLNYPINFSKKLHYFLLDKTSDKDIEEIFSLYRN